jgi:hypothetical protein
VPYASSKPKCLRTSELFNHASNLKSYSTFEITWLAPTQWPSSYLQMILSMILSESAVPVLRLWYLHSPLTKELIPFIDIPKCLLGVASF